MEVKEALKITLRRPRVLEGTVEAHLVLAQLAIAEDRLEASATEVPVVLSMAEVVEEVGTAEEEAMYPVVEVDPVIPPLLQ